MWSEFNYPKVKIDSEFSRDFRAIQIIRDSPVRPCVSVTVSGFRIVLRKCTAYRENKKPNSSVYFRYRYRYRKSDSFGFRETYRKYTEVFGLVLVCFWPLFGKKYTQKPKKLFFSVPVRARMVLNAFLECMYLAYLAGAGKWRTLRIWRTSRISP